MVSSFERRRKPAIVSSITFCGSLAFILQSAVSRVRPANLARGAACSAGDLSPRVGLSRFGISRLSVGRRMESACTGGGLFFERCRERHWLRARPPRGRTVARFEKRLCLPARRSRPVVPFERRGPERGTIEQTKTGRPTQVAQADGWRSIKRRRPLVVVASGSGGGLHGPRA